MSVLTISQISEHCFYWLVFSTGISRKLISTVCYIFSYFSISINCRSWVCKLHNIFPTCGETEAYLYLRAFNIVIYESSIPTIFLVCQLFQSDL